MKKRSRLQRIHHHMIERCYNPNCKDYKNYGGRGITVCEEWRDKTKVNLNGYLYNKGTLNFCNWAYSNGYSDELSIDRVNVNKNYEPLNCRWVNSKVQANNTRTNRFIKYQGKTQTLSQWCDELGLSYDKIESRINACNWSIERAFETKVDPKLRMITYKNKTQSLADWCRELGLKYSTIERRLNRFSYSVDKAFEKKTKKLLCYKGEEKSISEWGKELGLNPNTISMRLKYGWSIEKALETKCKGE